MRVIIWTFVSSGNGGYAFYSAAEGKTWLATAMGVATVAAILSAMFAIVEES